MDLSIIIVNWNSRDYLRKCIDSILAMIYGIEYEIVVIDSASFDGCDEMLRQCYSQVRFIQSDQNLGFAKANNEAFKVSRGRNLLFLNPDTELEGDAVQALLSHLKFLPNAGAVGAKLLNTDLSIQTSCIQSFPTLLNQILDSEVLRQRFPRFRLWGTARLFEKFATTAEVDAISGACLMIKRSVFESVGMFSTDYFMYSEDIDLCFKIWKAGWKIYYVPTAQVIHHGSGSSSQSSVNTFSSVMMLESRWRFFRKTRPPIYCKIYRLAIFSSSLIRIGLLLLAWPITILRREGSSIEFALKRWGARLRWTLGLEKWVKSY